MEFSPRTGQCHVERRAVQVVAEIVPVALDVTRHGRVS